MPITLTSGEIAIRLLCAVLIGAVLGLNRTEHGRAAGLRTSILVCLAACIAMLQVNLLLPLAGRSSDSFVMNDLMRLPLGILSGMGFIGAGAIVRRDNLVLGVTTAATLWFLTVEGLCFGGGQIALGLAGAVIGICILTGLKIVEQRLKQDRQGRLRIVLVDARPEEHEIGEMLRSEGFRIDSFGLVASQNTGESELNCELHWRAQPDDSRVPQVIHRLVSRAGVVRVEWTPQGH